MRQEIAPVILKSVRARAPKAEEAARGMLAACEAIGQERTGAWRDARPGLLALMTTLPGRPYNGLYGLNVNATPEDATELVAALGASGVSWCARLRPSVPSEVDAALEDAGLFAEDETLLMATSLANDEVVHREPLELVLSTSRHEDDLAIATVLGAAFGTPPLNAERLLDFQREGIQWHLGKVNEVPVTCAMSVVVDDAVGIFAVGTVPEARGKGYASAVTSRALAHGLAAGATIAVLTASPDVKNVYEDLGFTVLERWRRLVPSN